jgi:glycosyltransferase involved in cell wall biosynthesis
LQKSSIIAFTSEWARKSALEFFEISEKKTVVLPFGANFEKAPTRSIAEKRELQKVCKLLFVGVSWENKGGAIAYDCFLKLLEKGIEVELTVCGCIPPAEFRHEKLTIIPFLDKHIPAEREKLYQLYEEASFFILPTRFEAFGVVFCEASSYGLISLATNTGGVAGVISEGINGFLFEPEMGGEVYAKKIVDIIKNKEQYKTLCLNARKLYEEKLNWEAWGIGLKAKLIEMGYG